MKFGEFASEYSRGRKRYPKGVIEYIVNTISQKGMVLDIGCGTGISSIQMTSSGLPVIGCDIDKRMIRQASEVPNLVVASSQSLPFISHQFAAVTAFGAFHWFCDPTSISELMRVIKPGGSFLVINKRDVNNIRTVIYKTIEKHGVSISDPKEGYNPARILAQYSSKVQLKGFRAIEAYSYSEALSWVKSMSVWLSIPQEKRGLIEKDLSSMFSSLGPNVEREISVDVVSSVVN